MSEQKWLEVANELANRADDLSALLDGNLSHKVREPIRRAVHSMLCMARELREREALAPERDEFGRTAQDRYTDEHGDHQSMYDLDY